MTRMLITGATGNVGRAVLDNLLATPTLVINKASYNPSLKADERFFDFNDLPKSAASLDEIDVLFLLRPPQLADTKRYFAPLIASCQEKKVKHIVFLSVQGAGEHAIIPHAKIEKMIVESGIPYTFIRPSYFMQNLTGILQEDIRQKGMIFLPAGGAAFLWVDVLDIGKAIAVVLGNVTKHRNRIYTITGTQLLNFESVARQMSRILGKTIRYTSPNLLRFFRQKRKEGLPSAFIFVMMVLHVLPRFEKSPAISADFFQLTGQQPNSLENFIAANKDRWL